MKRLTRGEAIRAKCLDCCCGSYTEVRLCPVPDCALYRYRLGHEELAADKETAVYHDTEKGQHAPEFLE